jgi:hypothetical protein
MLSRQRRSASQKQAALDRAKQRLRERGWSYRRAAPVVEVSFSHLAHVLRGFRESRALLKRIEDIPPALGSKQK